MRQSQERWDKFKALSTTVVEKQIIDIHDRARIEWEESSRKVIAEIAKNTDESRKRAIELSLGDTSGKFEKMRDQMDKLTEINLENAQKANDAAEATYRTAMTLLFGSIATAVEEQTATTREIAGNIAQASQGIQEVNENVSNSSSAAGTISEDISGVSSAAQSISSSSNEVKDSSRALLDRANELNDIVGRFKV